MTWKPNKYDPPFDGKPCPACPMEIRNLMAVVHNLLQAHKNGDLGKTFQYLENDLERAYELARPIMDHHFSSEKHAYGTPEQQEQRIAPLREMDEEIKKWEKYFNDKMSVQQRLQASSRI